MKTILRYLILVSTFPLALHAQHKFSSVKIYASPSKAERSALIGLLEIDHYQVTEDGAIVTELGSREMQRLQTSRTRYEILVDDIIADLEQQNRAWFSRQPNDASRYAFEQPNSTVDRIIPKPTAFTVQSGFGGYYSFAQMEAAMDALVAAYPTIASKTSLGLTHEGRNIWCIKISDAVASDEDEPEVLFLGLQHAREAIGGSSMIFFMQYLCQFYSTDTRIHDVVNNREIFIVPCMNPDGWEYNRLNGGAGAGWRKNRRNNPGSDEGVDLNRNWGVDWGNCSAPIQGDPNSCGSNSYAAGTYYGPSAFSEPETQAIRNFTLSHHLTAMIDQHAYGPYYSLPFGRPSLSSNVMAPIDGKFYTHIAAAMGKYNGMRAGNSYEALDYEVAGGVKDWMLKGEVASKGKVMGLTGEGGAGGGTGGANGSFWPPASQIINLCKGIVFQNLQLLLAAGSYVNLQDASPLNLNAKAGSMQFEMIRTGLKNDPVTVTLLPLQNITVTGSPVISTIPTYGNAVTGSVPYTLPAGLTNGQRVRFAWKIETGGITWYDTVTKFYNAQQLLYDNLDGAITTNWTTSSWGLTAAGTGYGGGSSRAMSESPGGNYPASTTRTITYRNTFDLNNATSATLSFWVKHRAENFRDKLQVQVSTDGTNWTAIPGNTTVQEPGTLDGSTINGQPALTGIREEWTRELFDLSVYNGNAQVYLRFVFTSGAANSFAFSEDDGFYIDEIMVVKTTDPLITLPVEFLDFYGRLNISGQAELNWAAIADNRHSHFIVERSNDGTTWTALGQVTLLPYAFLDVSPAGGNNFYRIRQVDTDGRYSFSKVINIYYDPNRFLIRCFPNPASDQLTIQLVTAIQQPVNIEISNLSGQIIYRKEAITGANNIQVNTSAYASQVFVLRVRGRQGELLGITRFVKE